MEPLFLRHSPLHIEPLVSGVSVGSVSLRTRRWWMWDGRRHWGQRGGWMKAAEAGLLCEMMCIIPTGCLRFATLRLYPGLFVFRSFVLLPEDMSALI